MFCPELGASQDTGLCLGDMGTPISFILIGIGALNPCSSFGNSLNHRSAVSPLAKSHG